VRILNQDPESKLNWINSDLDTLGRLRSSGKLPNSVAARNFTN
jgi:hypothetical protein